MNTNLYSEIWTSTSCMKIIFLLTRAVDRDKMESEQVAVRTAEKLLKVRNEKDHISFIHVNGES